MMKVYDLDTALSQPTATTALYLSNRNFSRFPLEILELTQLKVLDLSACRITELPAEIGALKHLHTLVLHGNALQDLPLVLHSLPLRLLSLGVNGLTKIPEVVFELDNLETLLLPDNLLDALPEALFKQERLKRLDLSGNRLKDLPKAIGQLKNLQQLKLGGNQLKTLPATLFQCQKLEDLALYDNHLEKIPAGIGKLKALVTLDVSGNQLKALPAAIGSCQNLRRLRVHHNHLSNLPGALKACSRLEELHLAANRLRKLPAFLATLPRLSRLDASDNRLSKWPSLPPSLLSLDLSSNPLATMSSQIGHLTKLKTLNIDRTALHRLPETIGHLQAMETLSAKDVVIETPPRGLFALRRATHLNGLFEAEKTDRVMALWQIARETGLPAHLLKALFESMDSHPAALSRLSIKDLFALLQIGKWAFFIRRELFRRNPAPMDAGLHAGVTVFFAGETPFESANLAAALEKQGITIAAKPNRQMTHVLLGQRPDFHPSMARRGLVFLAESELTAFIDQVDARYLACHPTSAQVENLRRLLHHNDPANIEMALRMMQGGGVPEVLQAELLAVFLQSPSNIPRSLKDMMQSLLILNLPESRRDLLL